jgi:hypothetical protein
MAKHKFTVDNIFHKYDIIHLLNYFKIPARGEKTLSSFNGLARLFKCMRPLETIYDPDECYMFINQLSYESRRIGVSNYRINAAALLTGLLYIILDYSKGTIEVTR